MHQSGFLLWTVGSSRARVKLPLRSKNCPKNYTFPACGGEAELSEGMIKEIKIHSPHAGVKPTLATLVTMRRGLFPRVRGWSRVIRCSYDEQIVSSPRAGVKLSHGRSQNLVLRDGLPSLYPSSPFPAGGRNFVCAKNEIKFLFRPYSSQVQISSIPVSRGRKENHALYFTGYH